jgi:hypothetical protein
MRYVQNVGTAMVVSNIILILLREYMHSHKTAFYYGFSEVYLLNILICVLVLKSSKMCIALTMVTVLLLNLMNASLHDNYDVLEQVGSSLNSCIVSA